MRQSNLWTELKLRSHHSDFPFHQGHSFWSFIAEHAHIISIVHLTPTHLVRSNQDKQELLENSWQIFISFIYVKYVFYIIHFVCFHWKSSFPALHYDTTFAITILLKTADISTSRTPPTGIQYIYVYTQSHVRVDMIKSKTLKPRRKICFTVLFGLYSILNAPI